MIKLKKLIKEDIKDFNRIVDSEGLHKIVSGRDGLADARRKVSAIHKLTRDVKGAVLANLRDDEYKSHRRAWRELQPKIDKAAENLFDAIVDLVDLKKRHYNWVESVKKVKK
jgi:hypothetical protein